MRRQPRKVSRLPPALAERFTLKPGDPPHDIHRRGREQVLEVRARQAAVATLAHSKAPDALREATLDTRPQRILLFELGCLLALSRGLYRFVVGSGASDLRTVVEGYQMTARGLRTLGSGTLDASGSKAPGEALGFAGLLATGNPAGLIISTGMKVYGEESGSNKVEGRAKQTAKEIADVLKQRFAQQGWIN